MSKNKKNTKVQDNLVEVEESLRDFEVRSADIKDDICNYSLEIIRGKKVGWTANEKGKGLIEDDLRNAFAKLNVHLAYCDDVFKHNKLDIDDIDTMHTDELAMLYMVTGFKIKGGESNESIILIGNKYLSSGSRMELESPKISIDNLSSYKWWNELKAAADQCREEVALYHEGKFTAVETEDDEESGLQQTSMTFTKDEQGDHDDDSLESGKI